MRLKYNFFVVLLLFVLTACNETITGVVVDAETGQPIEGAVILVEWTQTKGVPGLSYTESYKVVEVVTDNEGKGSIDGAIGPFINAPSVTIYKQGYVAWNNKYIFPDWTKRKDFKWENNYVFKLEKFKPEYSYDKHTDFISSSMQIGASEKKRQLLKAIRWEQLKALEERSNNAK